VRPDFDKNAGLKLAIKHKKILTPDRLRRAEAVPKA